MDGDGHSYRVNSDSVALEVAKALGAVKLVFVTTAEGLMVNGAVARQVAVDELEKAIQDGTVAPGQVSKARHAVAACQAGVPRVHVISGQVDEGLLAEVFSNEGIGTLIYANDYRQIRRAKKRDVRSIQQLIKASVESEELLPRTRAAIEKQLDDYYIFEVDKNPVACVALHTYPDTGQGELACLCVRATHENQGVGRRMVRLRRRSRARDGPQVPDGPLDSGLQLLPVEGRFRRRHTRRSASRPPRALRAEQTAIEGPGEDARAGIRRPKPPRQLTRRRSRRSLRGHRSNPQLPSHASSLWAGIFTLVSVITIGFIGTYVYLMWQQGRATWLVYLVTAPFFAMGALLGYLGLRGLLRLLRFGHWHLEIRGPGALGRPLRRGCSRAATSRRRVRSDATCAA